MTDSEFRAQTVATFKARAKQTRIAALVTVLALVAIASIHLFVLTSVVVK